MKFLFWKCIDGLTVQPCSPPYTDLYQYNVSHTYIEGLERLKSHV